jgi:nitronate monooxygenase
MMDLCTHLGLQAPLIQAPMAGVQNHRLAAAVCEAGGLGSLPAAMLSPEALEAELQALTRATSRAFNVNFFCHATPEPDEAVEAAWRQLLAPYYAEWGLDIQAIPSSPARVPFNHAMADVLQAFKPAVVSFHFGLPAPDLLDRVKSWGSLVLSSATTVAEAQWLQAHGADAVIAQGLEAGGHRGMFLSDDLDQQRGLSNLLPNIIAAVSIPVIAAGGLATAQDLANVRQVGACGAQVGSAYLCCHESTTSELHRKALLAPDAPETELTRLFTGRPARGLVNRLMRELGPLNPGAPAFPLATAALTPLRVAAEMRQQADFTPLWAGQNFKACRTVSATDLTRDLRQGWA